MTSYWKPYTPPGEEQADSWDVKYIKPEDRPGGSHYENQQYNYGYKDTQQDYSQQYEQKSDYWLQPSNVANYYNQIQNNQYTDWMDDSFVNFIEQAYGLYEIANNGANWEEWKPLQLEDPARQFLGSFGAPPEELQPIGAEQPYPVMPEGEAQYGGLTKAQWDALPWGQRQLFNIFSTPQTAGAAIGLVASAGNPIGAGLGAGLGTLAEKFPWLAGAFDKLDVLAEGVERFVGAASVLYAGGEVQTFKDLEAAWQAGHLAYDVSRIDTKGVDTQMVNFLEQPEEITWTADQLLLESYNRIRSGEDVNKVYEDIQARTGDAGMMRDLLGHIIFDPLNVIGLFAVKGTSAALKLGMAANLFGDAGKIGSAGIDASRAAKAISSGLSDSKGVVEALKKTRKAWKSAFTTEEISDMGRVSRWFGSVGLEDGKPIDLTTKKYVAPTGAKAVADKALGGALSASLTSVIGAGMFGLPGAAITGVLGFAWGSKKGLSYLMDLTPVAKATGLVDEAVNTVGHTIMQSGDNVADKIKNVISVGNIDSGKATWMSGYFWGSSANSGPAMAIKQAEGNLKALLNTWETSAPKRTMLNNIAKALETTVDDVVKRMTDAAVKTDDAKKRAKYGAKAAEQVSDVKKIDILFKQIEEAARKTGNDDLLNEIKRGEFTTKELTDLFDTFIRDGNPATDKVAEAKMLGIVMEDANKWAASWFDVKPDETIVRTAQLLKNMQSLVLLQLSPTYLANNFINNMVTMATDGVLGFKTHKAIDNYWNRVGYTPARLRQGLTPAELGAAGTDAISEAQRVKGAMEKLNSKVTSFGEKYGKFGEASIKVEEWSSAQSYTSAHQRAWRNLWKPGKGFDRIDPQLQSLIGPELTDFVHDAIKSGLNKQEVENALWSDYATKSIDVLLEDASKNTGVDTKIAMDLIDDLGLTDKFRERLKGDPTADDIIKTFQEIQKEADDAIAKMQVEYAKNEAEKVAAKMGTEAAAGIFDLLNQESVFRQMSDSAHWKLQNDVWKMLDELPFTQKQRRAILSNMTKNERARYKRVNENTLNTYKAIAEAINKDSPIGVGLETGVKRIQDTWERFFADRDAIYKKLIDEDAGSAEWNAMQRQLLDMYKKAADAEMDAEMFLADQFARLVQAQYGDDALKASVAWREAMGKMRMELREEMHRFRESLLGMDYNQRRDAWNNFMPGYERKLVEFREAERRSAIPVYEAVRNAEPSAVPIPEKNQSFGMPVGFVDQFDSATIPQYLAYENGWYENVMPLLNELQRLYLSPDSKYGQTLKGANLDPAAVGEIRKYLGKVYGQMSDSKNLAQKFGEQGRDFALLNYGQRFGFDTLSTMVMPYQFWYGRSMLNWMARSMDKPGYLATWARIHAAQQKNQRQGMPTRLEGKIGIPINIPWKPDWVGDFLYIDPMRQLFPIQLLLEPFQDMAQSSTSVDRRATYIIEEWIASGEGNEGLLKEAKTNKEGELWDRALAQARLELDEGYNNPMDYMEAISGPLLPISWAAKMMQGRQDEISQLPVTRAIQALTSWATPGGINVEAPLRKWFGLPVDGNEYWEYYIKREMGWMAALGKYTPEEVEKAMIDKTGPIYQEALDIVGKRQSLRYFASSFASDYFPEGEQEARKLQAEFQAAIEADKVTEFFDKNPEYQAVLLTYAETPEDMLRKVAVSAIWEMSRELPKLTKDRLYAAFGEEFQTSFLDKETRSIDTIDTETLLAWSKAMGAELPELAKEYNVTPIQADVGTPAENQIFDWYYSERERLFGKDIKAINDRFWALPKENRNAFKKLHPELQPYWDWNKGVKQQYPRLDELTREKYERENLATFEIDPNDFNSALTNRMLGYFYSGQPLEGGARSELNRLWIKYGKPTDTLEQFIELLRSYFGQ